MSDVTTNNSPDRLLSPVEILKYLDEKYGLKFSLKSFYPMICRGDSPKKTRWRNRPKSTPKDIDEWVERHKSGRRFRPK
jgi:hypothetical protein